MKIDGTGKLLRIFVGESDRWHHQPLYMAIVEAARKAGLSGVSVFKGIEGYGGHSVIRLARVFDLSSDMPILVGSSTPTNGFARFYRCSTRW